MFSKEIKELREIYNKLLKVPNLDELLVQSSSVMNYLTEQGVCTAISLKSCPEIAIIDAEMGPDTMLKIHQHSSCYEMLIVYAEEGESKRRGLTVHYLDGAKQEVHVCGHIVIDKSVAHIVTCENKLRLIGITVPKDAGYP